MRSLVHSQKRSPSRLRVCSPCCGRRRRRTGGATGPRRGRPRATRTARLLRRRCGRCATCARRSPRRRAWRRGCAGRTSATRRPTGPSRRGSCGLSCASRSPAPRSPTWCGGAPRPSFRTPQPTPAELNARGAGLLTPPPTAARAPQALGFLCSLPAASADTRHRLFAENAVKLFLNLLSNPTWQARAGALQPPSHVSAGAPHCRKGGSAPRSAAAAARSRAGARGGGTGRVARERRQADRGRPARARRGPRPPARCRAALRLSSPQIPTLEALSTPSLTVPRSCPNPPTLSPQLRCLVGLLANASSSPAASVLRCCTAVDRLVLSSPFLDSALVASGLVASLARGPRSLLAAPPAARPPAAARLLATSGRALSRVRSRVRQAQALDHTDGSVRLEVLRVIKSVYQQHPKPKELLARCAPFACRRGGGRGPAGDAPRRALSELGLTRPHCAGTTCGRGSWRSRAGAARRRSSCSNRRRRC